MALRLEHTFATQLEGLYVPWKPKGFPAPALLLLNEPLATELGLDPKWLRSEGAAVLSGSKTPPELQPLAQAYAGHQFGSFNPQLGDGRAVLLGEVVTPQGARYDIQLKGSGTTPFSRNGDGRAALDSAVREYIVSEAMYALGVPTTRSLAVVTTGETVLRDRESPGAVLTRVAASHLRVGTLEFFAARQELDKLRRLVKYTLERHFPEHVDDANPAKSLLDAVAVVQARLVAQWMTIGFVHGVMNTDNVTLSGETIDYGPCAFMDVYDPKTVFSRIDRGGRYAFANQPGIGGWNLARMAEALLDLLADDPQDAIGLAEQSLDLYGSTLDAAWIGGMRRKLGLDGEQDEDIELIRSLLDWMHGAEADYTGTFRRLSASLRGETPAFADPTFVAWDEQWRERLGAADPKGTAEAMDRVNPLYIARNHRVEAALDAAVDGDLEPTRELMDVLSRPFEPQAGREAYSEPASPEFREGYRTHCNT